MFDPRLVAGLCADSYRPSGHPEEDVQRLASLSGLRVLNVGRNVLAIMPAPVHAPPPPRAPPQLALQTEVVVTARPILYANLMARGGTELISELGHGALAAEPTLNLAARLAVLPGLTAYSDMGLGQAATGNPEFITIRGLDASYNAYTMNGMPAPQSDPNTRALSLKMLPSFVLGSISVVKTPGAERPGDAIGGLVDMQTPTAFDFPERFTHISAHGDLDALAAKTGFDATGGALQAEAARRLAGGRLGLYVSAYYQKAASVAESGEVQAWAPSLQSQAEATDYSKVSALTATGFRNDFYQNQITQYGGDAAVTYRGRDYELSFDLIASRYADIGEDSQTSMRQGLVNTGVDASGRPVDFWGRSVGPGLSGDPAYAPQETASDYNARGRYAPYGVWVGDYFQLRDQTEDLYMAKLGGRRSVGDVTAAVSAAYGYSQQARPHYLESSSYTPILADDQVSIGWANSHTPTYTFSDPAAAAYVLNPANAALWKYQGEDSGSSDGVASAKIDVDYHPASATQPLIRTGAGLSISQRRQYEHDLFGDDDGNFSIVNAKGYATPYWAAAGPSVAAQSGVYLNNSFLGLPGQLKVFNRSALLAAVAPYVERSLYSINPITGADDWPNPGAYTQNDYNRGAASDQEGVYYAYASINQPLGEVLISGGLRYEYTDLSGRYWMPVTASAGRYQSAGHAYGEWLPNFSLNWRPAPGLCVQAAVRRSFSRPAASLLISPAVASLDGAVQIGNPNLKPTTAENYDLSVTYAGDENLAIGAALFHKSLSRFIYTASTTGLPPQATYSAVVEQGVIYTQPQNGGSAWLEGAEFNLTYRFNRLPGLLSGLGAIANATVQHSDASNDRPDHYGRKTWLPRAPEQIFNLDLYWARSGVRTDLNLRYTGLQLDNLTSYNVDNYFQPSTNIDWSASAPLGPYKVSLSARNLTDAPSLWKTFGKSKQYLGVQDGDGNGSYVSTGRIFEVGLERTW